MRAVVLCPGPSLLGGSVVPEVGNVSIGINEVVETFPVDWWVYADPPVPSKFVPLEKPVGICRLTAQGTMPVSLQDVPTLKWQEIAHPFHLHYSVLAALALAAHLGATEIDVYGADMRGEDGPHRSEDRWRRERVFFRDYCQLLGIPVRRHVAGGVFDGSTDRVCRESRQL